MADLFDEIARDVNAVLTQLATEMEAEVKEKLSTPVEYQKGPKGGSIAVHSQRGENPRRMSGSLQEDIQAELIVTGLESELVLSSSKPYAPILQDKLGRPVLSDTAEKYDEIVPDRVAAAISGNI